MSWSRWYLNLATHVGLLAVEVPHLEVHVEVVGIVEVIGSLLLSMTSGEVEELRGKCSRSRALHQPKQFQIHLSFSCVTGQWEWMLGCCFMQKLSLVLGVYTSCLIIK